MSGVEILSTEEVVTAFAFNWTAASIAYGVILVIVAIIGIVGSVQTGNWSIFFVMMIVCGVILNIILSGFAGVIFEIPTDYETHYKVIISDGTTLNDFLEKYEIIGWDGKICTVREKE